jgi:hypothetical protein
LTLLVILLSLSILLLSFSLRLSFSLLLSFSLCVNSVAVVGHFRAKTNTHLLGDAVQKWNTLSAEEKKV